MVRCVNEKDVSTAIKWARERELPLVTRSGGHSYAGFSSTYGLLLDLSMMTDISIDLSKGLATVAGGARNSNVYATLRDSNLSLLMAGVKLSEWVDWYWAGELDSTCGTMD